MPESMMVHSSKEFEQWVALKDKELKSLLYAAEQSGDAERAAKLRYESQNTTLESLMDMDRIRYMYP